MELEMPLFLSKLVSSNSFKIPGREKLVAKEPLEVVQWRLSRLHPVGFGFGLHPKAALGHIRSYWIVFCSSDNI